MRPRLGRHGALRLVLQAIVANRRRGRQAFLDIARIELDAGLLLVDVSAPHAGDSNRPAAPAAPTSAFACASLLLSRCASMRVGEAEQILDVMADFVRDDVRLREVARRAEAAIELAEEAQVDIDLLIGRTVERSDRRRRRRRTPTARLGEEHQARRG